MRSSTLCLLALVIVCHADLEWLKDYHCGTGEVSKLASYFIVGNLCKIAGPMNECCRQHDVCYTQCVSQRRCDADFDDCINEAEKWALPWYKGCIGLDAHAFIVKQVGHGVVPQECQQLVEVHLMEESEEWKERQRIRILDFIASKYDLASRMKRHKLVVEEGSGDED